MFIIICRTNNNEDLLITVSMPSIKVDTVGGGTVLGPQGSVLKMLGIKGVHYTFLSQNAQCLACIIATFIIVGKLLLFSALAARHLMHISYVQPLAGQHTDIITACYPWSHCQ